MPTLPASGYIENASRTVAEQKAALEAVRDVASVLPGGGARTELTIGSGTVTPATRDHGGQFTLDTEGDASTDDLDTITYTNLPSGAIVRVGAENAARVVTLKHGNGGAGEMLMADSADFVLDAIDKWMEFQRRGTSWVEIDRSYGEDHLDFRARHEIPQLTGGNILCPHEALVLSRPTAATIDVDADAVLLTDANGNQKRFASLDVTINMASAGAAGLDTGSEANSTWYHVWAIGKADGTLSAMVSTATARGSLTLPSGYTYSGYLGAAYNSSGGDLVDFYQRGTKVGSVMGTALSSGTATTYTAISLAAFVPPTAVMVKGNAQVRLVGGSQTEINGFLASDGSGTSRQYDNMQIRNVVSGFGAPSNLQIYVPFSLLMSTAQQIKYYVSIAGSCQMDVLVNGWEY